MHKAAIVILNYNGKQHLEQYLPSVIKYSSNYPVIIGDNASTDDSLTFLSQYYPEIQVISLSQNFGYSQGYNEILKQVDSKFYVLVNSDVELTEGWLPPIIKRLEQNSSLAAIQPKILSYRNKNQFEYAGACGGYLDIFGYPYCRGRVFNTIEIDDGQYDNIENVFWTSGACFVIKREAFEKVNGFDPQFFAHMEEIDLCWRLHRLNYTLEVYPESIVYHLGAGTLSYDNPKKAYLNHRNGLAMLIKNLPFKSLWKVLVRVILDWSSVLLYLFQGRTKHALMVLKAHLHLIRDCRYYFKVRKLINLPYNIDPALITPKSIVIAYYLKAQKKYTELSTK